MNSLDQLLDLHLTLKGPYPGKNHKKIGDFILAFKYDHMM